MDIQEIEIVKKERIENLNKIVEVYRSTERKSKQILTAIIVIGAIALYFLLFDLLGGIWGFIVTIAILGAGVCCVDTLGISFKNAPASDSKLAYQACIEMEALINIKNGNYAHYGHNIVTVGTGKHIQLYEKFIKLYPELSSKELKKISKIQVENKDIF